MKYVTILTPTFNRAHTLANAYYSLLAQTCRDFTWVIIDDGSTDSTEETVCGFIEQGLIDIKYRYKKNGGKHTAINDGLEQVLTELVLILDSDDTLTADAVELIIGKWAQYGQDMQIGHMRLLKKFMNGNIVGDEFPSSEYISNYICEINKGLKGDKFDVFRTSVLKRFYFPVVEGEKFLAEGAVWYRIGRAYNCVYINKAIYVCDYLSDGLTRTGRRLRIMNPLGAMINANESMYKDIRFTRRVKAGVLYGAYSFFSSRDLRSVIKQSNAMFLSVLCIPFSYALYLVWKIHYR